MGYESRSDWALESFYIVILHTVCIDKRPRGIDTLLGHLLVKRIPVTFHLSSTKIPEYLSQKQTQGRQKLEIHHVTKLFILSPKFLVCSLFTAHTCNVTAYTHHFDFGTGREYIMSCSGSHEARRYSYTARRSEGKGDV